MARYIPTDDMTRFLVSEFINTKIRAEFERLGLTVTISELKQDGTCRVNLWKQPEEWSFATALDGPQIDGRAWVDDRQACEWDFGDGLGRFLLDNVN